MKKDEEKIVYYNRYNGELCEEAVMGKGAIRWAYLTISGRILSGFIFGNSILSRLLGLYFDSFLSRRQIKKTISDLNIDSNEFLLPVDDFRNFNDFFTRRLKPEARPFDDKKNVIVSPADGRVLVYPEATADSIISIKGMQDSVSNFVGCSIEGFDDCSVAVVRLCPSDYHRYHFPCGGRILDSGKIAGLYHSVNPVALDSEANIFCRNKREYTLCKNEKGKFIISEVGAFGVSGIVQTYKGIDFHKMDEKGYFKFGGSTVVLIFPRGSVKFSDDLIKHSAESRETLIHVGDTLALWS
jgi:phosphatidylserine decarboxylase